MAEKHKLSPRWRAALGGAVLTAGLGMVSWQSQVGQLLQHLSYDLVTVAKPPRAANDVVIIGMDDRSYAELNQRPDHWDRSLHARLLDRLTADGARLVVFDIVLSDPGDPEPNADLAGAMARNGKVVIAASYASVAAGLGDQPVPPPDVFATNAAWGVPKGRFAEETVARQYAYPDGVDPAPVLAWEAARVAGAQLPKDLRATRNYWLNYYGPGKPGPAIPYTSYVEATNQPPGHFRNKLVFVGEDVKAYYPGHKYDRQRTPFTRWGGGLMPGVELTATASLNLVHDDSLRSWPAWAELVLMLGFGLLGGAGFALLRSTVAGAVGVFVILALALLGVWMAVRQHAFFSWLNIAAVQVPVAFTWAWHVAHRRRRAEPAASQASPPSSEVPTRPETGPASPPVSSPQPPRIPDHTLLRCVGKGSYGEVWLARNAVGLYHAVKIVHRRSFQSTAPYEREFRGIQKFMPVSRDHPNLVQLLHVGRDDVQGYFFYIMEAADGEKARPEVDPERYTPKHLGAVLRKVGRLPADQCISLGLQLSAALVFLHERKLIHRDIKPANIIFVHGVPKLADIGLVTDIGTGGRAPTFLGTEGYIPPEGPGTPGADVFALGIVLYEALTGLSCREFPDFPATLKERAVGMPIRLEEILLRACHARPELRYPSAVELQADLRHLASGNAATHPT